jgi:hypothetical protein
MKIRVDDFNVGSEHSPLADENTWAIADESNVVIHPDTISNFDDRVRSASLDVNVPTEEVSGRITTELNRTIETNSSPACALNRLENCRPALNIRAVRKEAKFRYSITLINF